MSKHSKEFKVVRAIEEVRIKKWGQQLTVEREELGKTFEKLDV